MWSALPAEPGLSREDRSRCSCGSSGSRLGLYVGLQPVWRRQNSTAARPAAHLQEAPGGHHEHGAAGHLLHPQGWLIVPPAWLQCMCPADRLRSAATAAAGSGASQQLATRAKDANRGDRKRTQPSTLSVCRRAQTDWTTVGAAKVQCTPVLPAGVRQSSPRRHLSLSDVLRWACPQEASLTGLLPAVQPELSFKCYGMLRQ